MSDILETDKSFGNSGLGIGTSATGLIKHGISTTIVELDPAVYQYAKEFFDLPLNHTAHITNAIDFVRKEEQQQSDGQHIKKYDYILHDVFTGGAVPAALFTSEFLNSTKSLLKKEGVIAIVRPFLALMYQVTFFLIYRIELRWRYQPICCTICHLDYSFGLYSLPSF